jgi:hypothetical protein
MGIAGVLSGDIFLVISALYAILDASTQIRG